MTHAHTDPFADFQSDDLSAAPTAVDTFLAASARYARATVAPGPVKAEVPMLACGKCAGRGVFRSYSGRVLGDCFTCRGTGQVRGLKQDAASVQRRERAAERRDAQRAEQAEAQLAWREAHSDVVAWIDAKAERGNNFAQSLAQSLARFGSLTEGQINAVRRCIALDAERVQQRAAAAPSVAGEGFTTLLAGFAKAKEAGLKHPKVRTGELTFSCASATSANAGCLYVKAGETYLGKITPAGQFFRGRDCTPSQADTVARVGRDPMAEAVAHGKRTGACSICARELTDPVSIERGIGPICAERFGW